MLWRRKERPAHILAGIYGKLHSIDCWRFSHSSSSPHFPLICRKPFSTRSTGCGNHYQVLGIQRYASQDEIKQAFYMLTKKYHPDVVGSSDGTNQKFLEIHEAYETLRDEQKRRQYDMKLAEQPFEWTRYQSGNWARNKEAQAHRNYRKWRQSEILPTNTFIGLGHVSDRFYGSPELMETDLKWVMQARNSDWLDREEAKRRDRNRKIAKYFQRNWKGFLSVSLFSFFCYYYGKFNKIPIR